MAPAIPRYYQAKAQLVDLLTDLPDGTPFPPERELADLLGMARTTVRKALDELVLQGRLIRKPGRQGTVVAPRKQVHRLSVDSVVNDLVTRVAVTFKQVGTAGDGVHVEWLLVTDGEPIGMRSTYLPAARFPGLLKRYDPKIPLRRFLEERYRVQYADTHPWCTTVLATPRVAQLVGVRAATPMLSLAWQSHDTDGVPLERSWTVLRSDRTHLSMRLR